MRLVILKIWRLTFRKLWYLIFDNSPLNVLGKLVYPLVSRKRLQKAIRQSFQDYSLKTIFSEIIMAGYNQYYKSLSQQEKEKLNRELVWGSNAVSWNYTKEKSYTKDLSQEFLPHRKYILSFINTQIVDCSTFSLNEIGTGNGMTLEYMQDKFNFKSYVGIDINCEIINHNTKKYPSIDFKCVDSNYYFKDINDNLFVLSLGCLMYFQQSTLEDFFQILSQKKNIVYIAMNEPVIATYRTLDKSLERDRFQLTHNYPKLLQIYGFNIEFEKLEDNRLTLIANNKDK
jgi:hypothetical protein